MADSELKRARDRAFSFYRNHKRYLARIEKRCIETPTPELQLECAERRGILRGIQLCWDAIEKINDDTTIPGLGPNDPSLYGGGGT